jgi:hypothetical protein
MRYGLMPQVPTSIASEGVLTATEWRELIASCGLTIVRWQTRYFLGPLPRCSVVARK